MSSPKVKKNFSTGYLRTSHFINRAFNVILALILILLALPVFLLISLLLLLTDGRPLFYRGIRLGIHKKPFTMYKFRTLVRDAEKIVGPKLISDRQKLVTKLGKVLRDVRLDELPQLFNVLKGDMDFVGPRPERLEIYQNICCHIRDYDKRFDVKPGLMGFSQMFTPHSSPKRLRVLIDNRLIRMKQVLLIDALIILQATLVVVRVVVRKSLKYCRVIIIESRLLHRYERKRAVERMRPPRATVSFGLDGCLPREEGDAARLIDINDEAFLVRCNHEIKQPFPRMFRLETEINHRSERRKRKVSVCEGSLLRMSKREDGQYDYVIRYQPISPLNFYMIRQYFLKESFC